MAKLRVPGLQGWIGARSIPVWGPWHHYKPLEGCCLLPRGCKFPLWGKPKAQSPPAHDQSLAGQHGHSHTPPLPQLLWVLHPACFCRKKGTGASSPAPQSPPAPILLGALSTSHVYAGPTAHTVTARSLPPSLLVQWRVSGAALSLQLGPRERNKGAIFISSLIGSGGRGQEKRPVFAKHDNRQEILLWLFEVGFFLSLFLFLKRAGTASVQSKNNQALAATSAMCSH